MHSWITNMQYLSSRGARARSSRLFRRFRRGGQSFTIIVDNAQYPLVDTPGNTVFKRIVIETEREVIDVERLWGVLSAASTRIPDCTFELIKKYSKFSGYSIRPYHISVNLWFIYRKNLLCLSISECWTIRVRTVRRTSGRGCSPSVRDCEKTATTDVLIVDNVTVQVRFSHRVVSSRCNVPRIVRFPRGTWIFVCVCALTRVTSSSHELG